MIIGKILLIVLILVAIYQIVNNIFDFSDDEFEDDIFEDFIDNKTGVIEPERVGFSVTHSDGSMSIGVSHFHNGRINEKVGIDDASMAWEIIKDNQ